MQRTLRRVAAAMGAPHRPNIGRAVAGAMWGGPWRRARRPGASSEALCKVHLSKQRSGHQSFKVQLPVGHACWCGENVLDELSASPIFSKLLFLVRGPGQLVYGSCTVAASRSSPRLEAAAAAVPCIKALVGDIFGSTRKRGHALAIGVADAARTVCRLAHLPPAFSKPGQRGSQPILKAKALLVRMIVGLQRSSLVSMLNTMRRWRVPPPDAERFVIFGLAHQWDDSPQQLREARPVASARTAKQRVSKSVLVQRTVVQMLAAERKEDGSACLHSRAESFVVPPLLVAGKSAEWLRGAMFAPAKWNGAITIEDAASMRALSESCDAVVLTLWPDGAASNGRWLRHVVAVGERDAWGTNVLLDPTELCLLHQIHRIKSGQLEALAMIGMAYCLSKLVRSGTVWSAFAENLSQVVEQRCDRIVMEAPPDHVRERVRRVFGLLYQLDEAHHDRAGGSKSSLHDDVSFLLSMDNSGMQDRDRFTHYCWSSSGRPCCEDLSETKEKLVRAYWNVFAAHSFPVASLSRWTHIRTVLATISAGFVARNILVVALVPVLQVSSDAEAAAAAISIESLGAGDADRQVEHSVRKQKVQRWLLRSETRFEVGIVYLTTSLLDKLVYHLMGGNSATKKRPGTIAKSDTPIHIKALMMEVREARGQFHALLRDFGREGHVTTELLVSLGVPPETVASGECVGLLRRLCLGMSAGLFRRLEVRLSVWPYPLWVLADDAATEQSRDDVCEALLSARPCCLGYFASRVRALFPDKASLKGPLAQLTLTMWLRTLVWSVYGCEREHGSIRRLVNGTGAGPARNFTLAARERVLEETRGIHMQRVHCDPRQEAEGPAKPAKRLRGVAEEEPASIEENPLYGQILPRQPEAGGEASSSAGPQGGAVASRPNQAIVESALEPRGLSSTDVWGGPFVSRVFCYWAQVYGGSVVGPMLGEVFRGLLLGRSTYPFRRGACHTDCALSLYLELGLSRRSCTCLATLRCTSVVATLATLKWHRRITRPRRPTRKHCPHRSWAHRMLPIRSQVSCFVLWRRERRSFVSPSSRSACPWKRRSVGRVGAQRLASCPEHLASNRWGHDRRLDCLSQGVRQTSLWATYTPHYVRPLRLIGVGALSYPKSSEKPFVLALLGLPGSPSWDIDVSSALVISLRGCSEGVEARICAAFAHRARLYVATGICGCL